MKTIANRAAVALLPVFLLSACESDDEKEKRLALAGEIVETSLALCDLQENRVSLANYEEKLSDVLNGLSYKSLNYFDGQNINICLDHRMEDIGYYSRRNTPVAIYHPEKRVMAVNTGRLRYGTSLVSRFSGQYDSNKLNRLDDVQMGVRYRSGKVTKRRWRDDGSEYQALQDNPELLTPPLAE